jgi:hypothetical protein
LVANPSTLESITSMPPRSSSNKEAPKPARKKAKKDTGKTKQGQPANLKGGQDTENGEDVDGVTNHRDRVRKPVL